MKFQRITKTQNAIMKFQRITKTQKIYAISGVVILMVAALSYVFVIQPMMLPSPEKEENIIVYRYNTAVATIDPGVYTADTQTFVIFNCYERLMMPTRSLPLSIVPSPVITGEPDVSADFKTWTFKLTQGVKFHDGSELTAEDVVWSMDRLLEMSKGVSFYFSPVLSVGDTTAVDQYTVEFHLRQPYYLFRTALVKFFIMNKDLMIEEARTGSYGANGDYGVGWIAEGHDAGCGPYMVENFDLAAGGTLVKFADYYSGWTDRQFDKAVYKVILEDATAKMAFLSGEIDTTHYGLSYETFMELKALPGIRVLEISSWSPWFVFMHTQRPPLDDVHVRRALSYAFDYKTAVEQALNSIYVDGIGKAHGPVPPTMWGYNSQVPSYTLNLTLAKEELAKSKYTPAELANFDMKCLIMAGSASHEAVYFMLKQACDALGLKVEPMAQIWAALDLTTSDNNTCPHFTAVQYTAILPHPHVFTYLSFSELGWGSYYGASWWRNDTVDELYEMTFETTDLETQKQYQAETQMIINENAPAIFVGVKVQRQAIREHVQNFFYAPLSGEFQNVYPLWTTKGLT